MRQVLLLWADTMQELFLAFKLLPDRASGLKACKPACILLSNSQLVEYSKPVEVIWSLLTHLVHTPANASVVLHMQARSSASDTDMSEQTEAATAQQDALPDVPDLSRSRLDRLSSSAKRQADSSWADFESPHKRQEFDQSPADTAAAADRQDDRSSMTDAGDASAADAQNAAVQGSAPGSSQAVGSDAVAAGNSGGGLLSYIPGTQANRASHANDRDQHASSAVGGLASYIPGTQANRAAHADQTPDPYLGDGPAARLASYIPGGTTAGRLASYLPGSGTAGRLADYAVSRAEQGFAHYSQHPTAEASLTGSGVSSVRDTGSSGGGSSSGGGGIMSYIPGTEANQTSTAAHNLGLDSPLDIPAGRDPASDIPGTQATQGSHAEQGQDSESGSGKGGTGGLTRHAPDGDADTASGSLPGQSGGGSLAGSPASHATGREANQEFAAEQGPRAQADTDGGAADGTHRRTNDGSASGAGDSLVGSVSGTEAHRTAEVEGRHNAASASNTGSGELAGGCCLVCPGQACRAVARKKKRKLYGSWGSSWEPHEAAAQNAGQGLQDFVQRKPVSVQGTSSAHIDSWSAYQHQLHLLTV